MPLGKEGGKKMSQHQTKNHQLQKNQALGEEDSNFYRFGFAESKKPKIAFVHKAFEEFASKQAEAIAVEHLGETITYGELNQRANELAVYLRAQGIGLGDRVGLFLERSIEMVVGILAVLKAGAAYVPQDARISPDDHLKAVVNASGIDLVLTTDRFSGKLQKLFRESHQDLQVISLAPFLSNEFEIDLSAFTSDPIRFCAVEDPPFEIDYSNRECFILFTSGTTGQPNGVRVTHKNLCNLIQTSPGDLDVRPGMRVSQILNIAFDMAAWEILNTLSHGGTLVIRGKDIQKTVSTVNVVIATPSILSSLNIDLCHRVKTVAVAGEPCPLELADRWASFCDFYIGCGPTEVTIVNTLKKHRFGEGRITIGKPTPNNTVYILDAQMRPCPIGEIGEMWAGGDGVSLGYLNNEELNKDRYRPDPFLGEDKKMFRTRDLGRWTEDGQLEHHGRTDDQVKIKGFRVELDSVSNLLEKHTACQRAVTLKVDKDLLIAFVKAEIMNTESLRIYLQESLPYYSVPELIISLKEFPKTDRGKVNKERLRNFAREYHALMAPILQPEKTETQEIGAKAC
jgi:amino acid adenylation domain-containing protein